MGLIKQGVNNNLAASQRKTTKTGIINTEHLGLNTLFLYKSTISGQLICYKADRRGKGGKPFPLLSVSVLKVAQLKTQSL